MKIFTRIVLFLCLGFPLGALAQVHASVKHSSDVAELVRNLSTHGKKKFRIDIVAETSGGGKVKQRLDYEWLNDTLLKSRYSGIKSQYSFKEDKFEYIRTREDSLLHVRPDEFSIVTDSNGFSAVRLFRIQDGDTQMIREMRNRWTDTSKIVESIFVHGDRISGFKAISTDLNDSITTSEAYEWKDQEWQLVFSERLITRTHWEDLVKVEKVENVKNYFSPGKEEKAQSSTRITKTYYDSDQLIQRIEILVSDESGERKSTIQHKIQR